MQISELVSINYDKLNENDLHIWKYISNNQDCCTKITIEELGKKCSVSRTTILRFTKKIGLEGFSELKYLLRNEQKNRVAESRLIDIDELFNTHFKMINELKKKNFDNCCKMIENSKRIFVVSSGVFQRLLAQELKRAFLKQKVIMTDITGNSEILFLKKCVDENDLVILISLSGETDSILELVKTLKTKQTKTISFTRLNSNSLAKMVDEPIYVSSSLSGEFLIEPYTSSTMFYATVEMLYVNYVNYIENKNNNRF